MTRPRTKLALAAAALLAAGAASAATPRLTYSGTLQDASGRPVTTASALQFRFYAQETGGSAVWEDAVLVTPDATGWFVAVLGALPANPIDPADFAGPVWLGVTVSGDAAELSPRMQLTSAPGALVAASVPWDGVTGKPATFPVDPAQVQTRIQNACAPGQFATGVGANGTLACGVDQNSGGTLTGVSAGYGLSGGGTSGAVALAVRSGFGLANPGDGSVAVDAAAVQRRVTGACNPGQYVRAVNSDGTVTCGTDAGGTVTSVSANPPLVTSGGATAPVLGLRSAETIGFSCQNTGCTATTTQTHTFCALTHVEWRNFGNTWTGSAACVLAGTPGATWTLTAALPGGATTGTASCGAVCF